MNVIDKLNDLNGIKHGWHFGEGKSLNNDVYSLGCYLIERISMIGFTELDCFLGINGELIITIYKDEHYIELNINKFLYIDFVYQVNDKDIIYEEEMNFVMIIDKIKEIYEKTKGGN
jgi:hypothetical protein